ncbi:MAG: hypothetical protein KF770_07590 [Anaerolineae bacterium]|nr:hypothetical protein [Anaerolineae bacterium]
MITSNPPQTYYCPPHIYWAYDAACTLVVNEQTGQAHRLFGQEAAVWDWLILGYPFARLVQFIAAYANLPTPQAERCLRRLLAAWQTDGLLQEEGHHG